MKEIIPSVAKEKLIEELTHDKFIRNTNYGNNELYIFDHRDSPNLMREVGRLRELSFRLAGGGTGKELDIDKYDISEDPYQQLIVWDPKHKEILGGYRFYLPKESQSGDEIENKLVTTHLFRFSDKFKKEYLPYMIELGRSFVQPAYQSSNRARKGIYALDNLWDGLGTLVVDNPRIKYLFGKVTMYPHFDPKARNAILYFLNKYFPDNEKLVVPIEPLEQDVDIKDLEKTFIGKDYLADYKILIKKVRHHGENIPALINAYMNLSPTLKIFGTVITKDFGDVEETGMMITINDIYNTKVERHISTYDRVKYYLKKDKFYLGGQKDKEQH